MNILFTSIGRRVELVQTFRDASRVTENRMVLMGADISSSAPALYFCDKQFLVPKISDPKYIQKLLEICKDNQIDCLIPTIDTDLLILSKSKTQFALLGTNVLVSEQEKISICRDKRLTANYFKSLGLMTPRTVDDISRYTSGFPAFIKPLNGSSSIHAYKVACMDELNDFVKIVPDYIIQPYITGCEYTVDIFCDFFGNPVYITPRERISVRSGEVLKTRISQNSVIIEEMKLLVNDFKPCGPITVQLIHNEETDQNIYIEINPRFGGGAPLSMRAGANSAQALIQILQGKRLAYVEYAANDGATFSRYDQSICVYEGSPK